MSFWKNFRGGYQPLSDSNAAPDDATFTNEPISTGDKYSDVNRSSFYQGIKKSIVLQSLEVNRKVVTTTKRSKRLKMIEDGVNEEVLPIVLERWEEAMKRFQPKNTTNAEWGERQSRALQIAARSFALKNGSAALMLTRKHSL